MELKQLLKHLVTLPNSPNGREMRIRSLTSQGVSQNDAAYVVYTRDYERGFQLSQEEVNNWQSLDSRCPYPKDK